MNQLAFLHNDIATHARELRIPGVVTVRPGYTLRDGWPTTEPAIVVVVVPGTNTGGLRPSLAGVPVEIRQASSLEVLPAKDPQRFAQALARQPALRADAFPVVADMDETAPTASPFAAKPQLPYTAPPGIRLEPVQDRMSLTCHVSPDAGWPTLQAFFTATQNELAVGLYDFTARHILEGLQTSLAAGQRLHLTLDQPARNPTADQSDADTLRSLRTELGGQLQAAWALTRANPDAPRWIYPTAYHIKMAVRDQQAVWLSSGNWNNSNQPAIDPIAHPTAKDQAVARHSDRDWHVVVEHAGLAQMLHGYVMHDLEMAGQEEAGNLLAHQPEVLAVPLQPLAANTFHFHAPLRIENERVRITPLLTPDPGVYSSAMQQLLASAQHRLYIQLQYIHPSDAPADAGLATLIDTVVARINAGVDVRIILSQWQGQNGWLERLQAAGVTLQLVKLQNGVHNKGFVVDSRLVALGSQNWSGDGVLRNRDATFIIEHELAARYYETVFLHDWERLARQRLPD